jgi:hypothetical protein
MFPNRRQPRLKPLCQTYADQDAFLRDVPRLIIEHNIYGVDIDPRARRSPRWRCGCGRSGPGTRQG